MHGEGGSREGPCGIHAALAMCVCAWAPRQEVRASRTVGLRERRASVRGKTATPHCNRVVRPWPCTSGVVGRVRGRVTTVSDGMSDGDRVECSVARGLSPLSVDLHVAVTWLTLSPHRAVYG